MSLLTTASQTVGPYVRIGFQPMTLDAIAPTGVAGDRVSIRGRVFDGEGKAVSDGVLEIWQADGDGRYAHPEGAADGKRAAFRGFGRVLTGADGEFRFATIKPGRVAGEGGSMQAPHLVVTLFTRGLLKQLLTRIYFPGEPANAEDTVLQRVPAERRDTLIAKAGAADKSALEWNVVLQGPGETVFFDF